MKKISQGSSGNSSADSFDSTSSSNRKGLYYHMTVKFTRLNNGNLCFSADLPPLGNPSAGNEPNEQISRAATMASAVQPYSLTQQFPVNVALKPFNG